MHVCLVTPYPVRDDAVLGGVEAASLRLVHALCARPGVRVSVVAPAEQSAMERRGDVDVHWVRSGPRRLPGIIRYWTTERRAVQAAVGRIGADVVHVQAIAGWGIGLAGPRVFQMHGVPEAAVLHNGRRTRKLSSWVHVLVERRGRRSFPLVAVVGAHMTEQFASHFTGEVIVAENTVPDAYFEIDRTPVAGRVLFGGVVSPRKNTLGLLRAMSMVVKRRPDAALHVAGDVGAFPAYAKECVAAVEAMGIGSNVRFLRSISIDDMRAELAAAEVVVLPSFNESAPIIVCEAMAAGVPVITSRRDGMVHMVEDGVTGFLVEPDDDAGIADRILRVIDDPVQGAAMGACARSVAASRFSPAVLADTMLGCYERVLAQGTRR